MTLRSAGYRLAGAALATMLAGCGDVAGQVAARPAASAPAAAPVASPIPTPSTPPPTAAPPTPPPTAAPPATPRPPRVEILPPSKPQTIEVHLIGEPGDVVLWEIYRDGVLRTPRLGGSPLTIQGLYVGWNGTESIERMEGHTFLFRFVRPDGSEYAAISVLVPLPPGQTIAPDPTSYVIRTDLPIPPVTVFPPAGPAAPPAPAGPPTPRPTDGSTSANLRLDPSGGVGARPGLTIVSTPNTYVYLTIRVDGVVYSAPTRLRIGSDGTSHVSIDNIDPRSFYSGKVLTFAVTRPDGSEVGQATMYIPSF